MTNPEKNKISMQPPRGTRDVLPGESEQWQKLEVLARTTLMFAGYREIRLPIFEQTELFKRSAGEDSDIVGKEMYTFTDKSGRSLTLRPEGTAATVRALLNAFGTRLPGLSKFFYLGPFFRNEAVQAGRYRQFNQLGLEAFGSACPALDAEVISLACQFLKAAGVNDFDVQLNSIGCPKCRPAYRETLKQSMQDKLPSLCDDCKNRFDRNPLRMLDCKVEADQKQFENLPMPIDSLCEECSRQWLQVYALTLGLDIPVSINKRLVRGLDYYTGTVFEIVSSDARLGAGSTLAAGGRYDNLVESLGGPSTPAVGWGLGLERLLLLLDKQNATDVDVFVVSTQLNVALQVATRLRKAGISADFDIPSSGPSSRKFTKQLKKANDRRCPWVLIICENELAAGVAKLKNMETGEEQEVALSDLETSVGKLIAEQL